MLTFSPFRTKDQKPGFLTKSMFLDNKGQRNPVSFAGEKGDRPFAYARTYGPDGVTTSLKAGAVRQLAVYGKKRWGVFFVN
ncbi:MAG TPA: hypothetical protein IGS52_03925 [Oscillatoriaceae cyanobacterium M33_DOE_052]|nr:hypothetical protein [Oscillatoriaceae cyanobacterium M33_DOE_052]